jgi:hypothetical protein
LGALEEWKALEQAVVTLEALMVQGQVEVQDSPAESVEGVDPAVVAVPAETVKQR